MWRLVCDDKLSLGELDSVSIDDVDSANAALDAQLAATIRASRKK